MPILRQVDQVGNYMESLTRTVEYVITMFGGVDIRNWKLLTTDEKIQDMVKSELRVHYDDPNFYVGWFSTPSERFFEYKNGTYELTCTIYPKLREIMRVVITEKL